MSLQAQVLTNVLFEINPRQGHASLSSHVLRSNTKVNRHSKLLYTGDIARSVSWQTLLKCEGATSTALPLGCFFVDMKGKVACHNQRSSLALN